MDDFFKLLWRTLMRSPSVRKEVYQFEWGDFFIWLIIAAIDTLIAGLIAAIIARIFNKDPETWFMRVAGVFMWLNIIYGIIIFIFL